MQDPQEAFGLLCRAVNIEQPYQWQQDAFERLMAHDVPDSIVVPTAAGKTMLLVAYVAALAEQALRGNVTLPRRLVHVVNRRILVDEASRLSERIRDALDHAPQLARLRNALAGLSASGKPLTVSMLRGGAQDNGEWALDPSTPAIILATPDMLGSRLLFRGYGLGRSRSATHAGLLSCDTLVIDDEAHLAPAFTALLRQVEMQAAPGARLIGRPALQVIEMTATLRSDISQRPLVCDVSTDPVLAERMHATKRLTLHNVAQAEKAESAVIAALCALALAHREADHAVAVFVNTPKAADAVALHLQKAGIESERIVTLTGTMRGHERGLLSTQHAFRRFESGPQRESGQSCYFIATSAGEIGLDIDADVGLFDLTTVDRFIQRCGRVNRRGLAIGAIHLVHAAVDELPEALREPAIRTLAMLQELPVRGEHRDASPLALNQLCAHPDYASAVQPSPALRRLEPAIVDMLAMTSLRLDEIKCPAPTHFIHGLVQDRAELHLAWRELPSAESNFTTWLEACPLAQQELAKLPLDAARKLLTTRLNAAVQADPASPRLIALALDAQGLPSNQPPFIAGMHAYRWVNALRPESVVLLACHAGGLNAQGLPSDDAAQAVPDVCAADGALKVCCFTAEVTIGEDGTVWALCSEHREGAQVADEEISKLVQRTVEPVAQGSVETDMPSYPNVLALLAILQPEADVLFHDAPAQFVAPYWHGTIKAWISPRRVRQSRSADTGDMAALATKDRALQEHLDLAAKAANRLATKLTFPRELRVDLVQAAREHDHGKQWERWQQAIGNKDLAHPLGKSGRAFFNHRINDGYRHELGSLVDRGAHLDTLTRHLVASHHGWSRPHFSVQARTKPGCDAAAQGAMQDFGALTKHLGPWAVAYLEAVLKSADVLAETLDSDLIAQTQPDTASGGFLRLSGVVADRSFTLITDVQNFGEYLAALGLATLLHRRGYHFTLGWQQSGLALLGVDEADVVDSLRELTQATQMPDEQATLRNTKDTTYPPLQLVFRDRDTWPLNHWLDESLREASRWKLGAGQTRASKTLDGLLHACTCSIAHPDFNPSHLFAFGGQKVNADASKFRFDAVTNWVAVDAGFSLNENDKFKSIRPWVELLCTLGLQQFFLPPADTNMRYFVWQQQIPMSLALAAAKGLLPIDKAGYAPVLKPNGKMKDVFASRPLPPERTAACPTMIQVI